MEEQVKFLKKVWLLTGVANFNEGKKYSFILYQSTEVGL